MFVDACAMISIIMRETTTDAYGKALAAASSPFTSTPAAWEAAIILARPDRLACDYPEAANTVLDWLDDRGIELRESTSPRDVLLHAAAVAERHGLGKRALSNFDCFHYAYAKVAGTPLLTLDRLLRETDVETLPAQG